MMELRPSEIFYSQDSISNTFDQRSRHAGTYIGETLDEICNGYCDIYDIPRMTVVERNGKWVTRDNRRLWVFRHLERLGICDEVPVTETFYIPEAKLTSENGGREIRVRGRPGGKWYQRPSATKKRTWSQPGNRKIYDTTLPVSTLIIPSQPFNNITNQQYGLPTETNWSSRGLSLGSTSQTPYQEFSFVKAQAVQQPASPQHNSSWQHQPATPRVSNPSTINADQSNVKANVFGAPEVQATRNHSPSRPTQSTSSMVYNPKTGNTDQGRLKASVVSAPAVPQQASQHHIPSWPQQSASPRVYNSTTSKTDQSSVYEPSVPKQASHHSSPRLEYKPVYPRVDTFPTKFQTCSYDKQSNVNEDNCCCIIL